MIFTFDLDGTITRYPELFVILGQSLRAAGHEVHILTGIDRGTFDAVRKAKHPCLSQEGWYDDVITSDNYNGDERTLAAKVMAGDMDNHELVGIFKRRVCAELGVALHFDDDTDNVRADGAVPVFGVARQ